jgi:hypothetical protein
MDRNVEPPRVATARAPREVKLRPHHEPAGQPERPAWDLLIRATLHTYRHAHGPDEAQRRLRHHVDAWPVAARQALTHIARRQETEHWPVETD